MVPDYVAKTTLPRGNAVWTYDVVDGQPAMWSPQIQKFNEGAAKNAAFNIVYSYGGDMEYYPDLANPFQTYFDAQNQDAAEIYGSTEGVNTVIAVVDGRMNGGQSWSPDLSKLNTTAVKEWASNTASLYCSFETVAGLQIDLEPYEAPYASHLTLFLSELSVLLRSKSNNCVSNKFPAGRSLSAFMLVDALNDDVLTALGPNGYALISGYDLSTAPPGTPSTPQQYRSALDSVIQQALQKVGKHGSFSLGIPAAASTHEFTTYTPASGDTITGHPMYDSSESNYLTEAIEAIRAANLANNKQFLGISVWGMSSVMAYPPHSFNKFEPSNPFVQAGELAYLQQNLSADPKDSYKAQNVYEMNIA
eukprot:GFYU01008324.1.p1 GENE.GFYU01008324.1~~GFYU01008324.1.p1  ORF type:complete len:413 (-),score=132.26 GFYU01008324.1:32-1120(-)